MANPSNLYAEKIFSEHPIALWALDEEFVNGQHDAVVSNIKNVNTFNAVTASAYALQDKPGYYIGSATDTFYSKNAGIPMVYGASNVTSIFPNEAADQPSLVIPGCGFLNNSGKFQDLTLEVWLRINSNSSELHRIVGPVASTDGLYVEKSFLILKIGKNVASHFISEWDRPMLVDIQSTKTGAALTINGEQVFYMEYEYPVTFPEIYDGSLEQDWIAFYAYSDIPVIEIDAVAIYPYAVSSVVAKRRFVYGQGVVYPSNINSAYGGTATLVDYAFSNYSKNYNYPTISKWVSGEIENLSVNGDFLSLPDYSLPTVVVSKSKNQWFEDLYDIQSEDNPKSFINLKPNETYGSGYIKFDSLDITANPAKSVFGVFEINEDSIGGTLFRIQNKFNGDYIDASVLEAATDYEIVITSSISGSVEELIKFSEVDFGVAVAVGFNIDSLVSTSSIELSQFFENPESLAVYVGGTETTSDTFDGKIYGFSFADQYSTDIIKNNVALDTFDLLTGFMLSKNTNLINFISTYTLTTNILVDQIILDIAIAGYWQDHVPLSFLSKTIDDGTSALDLIQFNISYPANGSVDPISGEITTQNIFKSFVSFQTVESNSQDNFDNVIPPTKNSVILPGTEWTNSKYEILDNFIVYPPDVADQNLLAMTIRFEYLVEGIFKYPITIKSLELASQAYNKNSETFIGSRFGTTITPYSETPYNPYVIYKGSTPYLYMTDKTGIRLVGNFNTERGLRLNVNEAKSESFNISLIQLSLKNIGLFGSGNLLLFETVSQTNHLRFYLNQTSPLASTIICKSVDSTGTESNFTELQFYVNGHSGNTIRSDEWTILAIRFDRPEDFGYENNKNNSINLLGPILFNNLSYYRVSDTDVKQRTAKISWNLIANDPEDGPYTWADWSTEAWRDIIFERYEEVPSIDPESVYRMYLGTNKIVAGDGETQELTLSGYKYVLYTNIAWQPEIIKPV
jgi:hypothetical protein